MMEYNSGDYRKDDTGQWADDHQNIGVDKFTRDDNALLYFMH